MVHYIVFSCGKWLEISSSMNIVGTPDVLKEEIVVVGGIHIIEKIQGNVHDRRLCVFEKVLIYKCE